MKRALPILALVLLSALDASAQTLTVKEWPVEWQGRPRDPSLDASGRVWFVGQTGNYIGQFDPATETFRRFELEPRTLPHNLIVASDGQVWYAGNGNGRVGRMDPQTGEVRTFMMPDAAARDPHTLVQAPNGTIWFTVQAGGYIGRITPSSGAVELLKPGEGRTLPYGIRLDSKGHAWVNLFGTNRITRVDPATFRARDYTTPRDAARTRRIEVTSDDVVWYVDYAGGHLGRLDPNTGSTKEWLLPGGAASNPYGMAVDENDRLWIAECARGATFIVGFDPKTEQFSHRTPVSSCIRHMTYHRPTRTLWFGTDANNIGRAVLPGA